VKPAYEGSSKGFTLIPGRFRKEAAQTVKEMLEIYRQPVLVEQFIDWSRSHVGMLAIPCESTG